MSLANTKVTDWQSLYKVGTTGRRYLMYLYTCWLQFVFVFSDCVQCGVCQRVGATSASIHWGVS